MPNRPEEQERQNPQRTAPRPDRQDQERINDPKRNAPERDEERRRQRQN